MTGRRILMAAIMIALSQDAAADHLHSICRRTRWCCGSLTSTTCRAGPGGGYHTASWTFEQAIFDTLVRYGDGNIELEPDIATSWESSPDATTFTFHMRGDARFSDGRAVTSEDFRYGVERVLNPVTRSRGMEYYRGIAGAEDFVAHRSAHLSGIETPDRTTIIFHLSAPDPIFAHKLGDLPFASAIPRDIARNGATTFRATSSAAARSCCANGSAGSASCW